MIKGHENLSSQWQKKHENRRQKLKTDQEPTLEDSDLGFNLVFEALFLRQLCSSWHDNRFSLGSSRNPRHE